MHSRVNTAFLPTKHIAMPSQAKSTVTSPLFSTIASTFHVPAPSSWAISVAASSALAKAARVESSSFSVATSLSQAHKAKATIAASNSLTIPYLTIRGGKPLSISEIALYSHIIVISFECSIHNSRSYFSCKSTNKYCILQINTQKNYNLLSERINIYINIRQVH